MGIQNIGLTKGHIHRLLPAEITEFPLSGVKPPPLALRRPCLGIMDQEEEGDVEP